MDGLTQSPGSSKPVRWRALGLYTLTFAAVAAAYQGALHLPLRLNLGPHVSAEFLLYGMPALLGLALMWPFGFWRADTLWRWRIAALAACAFIAILAGAVHLILLLEICGLFNPRC